VDSTSVSRVPSHRAIAIPISKIAEEVTGRRITASMVALGLVSGLSGLVSREALTKAMTERVPTGTEEMNAKALDAGFEEAERVLKSGIEISCR
jgi:2-oxoglutarate ferredoxin oxidoreductase subunit gamma